MVCMRSATAAVCIHGRCITAADRAAAAAAAAARSQDHRAGFGAQSRRHHVQLLWPCRRLPVVTKTVRQPRTAMPGLTRVSPCPLRLLQLLQCWGCWEGTTAGCCQWRQRRCCRRRCCATCAALCGRAHERHTPLTPCGRWQRHCKGDAAHSAEAAAGACTCW